MDDSRFLAAIGRDGAAFGESAAAAGMAARVESCPEWNVADLVWHLSEAHDFWGAVVAERVTHWDQVERTNRVAEDDLLANYANRLARLIEVLTNADPAQEVWTWSEQHDVSFVIRRMAQETAVHRWDADRAADRATAIEAALASDGIDEFLTHFLTHFAGEGAEPVGGSVHIHCADVAGEWTIRPRVGGDGYDVTREHAKGDCALRGGAGDLLLALWRRVGVDRIDVVGDTAVAARFLAATNLN